MFYDKSIFYIKMAADEFRLSDFQNTTSLHNSFLRRFYRKAIKSTASYKINENPLNIQSLVMK